MTTRRLVFLGVLAAACASPAAQTPVPGPAAPTGTATIAGVVQLDDATGPPVRRATLHLRPSGGALASERVVVTGDDGAFAFDRLPAGRYELSATKPGAVPVWYGSKRAGDSTGLTSIVVTDGQTMAGLVLKMPRGAVITGTVRDRAGQPLTGASVSVQQSRINFQTGERSFGYARSEGGVTDPRGVYRLYGLAPGSYIVRADAADDLALSSFRMATAAELQWVDRQLAATGSSADAPPATPERGRSVTYAPIYHPGTPVLSAAALITVGAGQEQSGIDIRLDLVPTATIDGVVQRPDGGALAGTTITLRSRENGGPFVGSVRTDPDGSFHVSDVMPGSYSLVARTTTGGGAQLWAKADITVDGNDQQASLTLQSGLFVSGRMTFVGTDLQPLSDLTLVRVTLSPASLDMIPGAGASAAADASGRFTVAGVMPGHYRLTASATGPAATGGWKLRSAMAGDRDVTDLPLDLTSGGSGELVLTFTDRAAELSGRLVDASNRPAPDYFVIVFPAEQKYWLPQARRIRAVRPATDGQYRVQNLPAGDYCVGVMTDVEQYQWFDPALLAQLKPQAVAVTLAEGDKKTQDLRLGIR